MAVLSLALVSATLVILALLRRFLRRSAAPNLRGPPVPSVLFGHEYLLTHQEEVGALDFQWMQEYGPTWRTKNFFGAEQVMTADPKALQHILHKSGYHYPKRVDKNHFLYLLLGPGILVTGEMHQRQRKTMNPAFSAPQLKLFVPLFQRTAKKVVGKWKADIEPSPGSPILVNQLLTRAALDVIGKAAFDYQFGALDELENPLTQEYRTIFNDANLYPTASEQIWRATWPYLTWPVLKLTKYTPTKLYTRFRRVNRMFENIGRPLYKAGLDTWDASQEKRRDAMSLLIKANASENPNTQMSEEEVVAQLHHLTAAGHETTSTTLTWMLYELAQHPVYQARVRAEIRAARAAVRERGDGDFSLEDLDNMKVTLAAIKETLRFHPLVFHLFRVADRDDVLPLSHPVIGKNGEVMSEIPVTAGQPILLSICGYNRLKDLWGEDADMWNPERFLGVQTEKGVKVGVYANLLTFSAGLRACIGWRFALYQLQAVAAELLDQFEFALPEDKPQIKRAPAGTMIPVIDTKEGKKSMMPLRVSLAG
ncbi:cytochrome P450 [Epithele typhae]|uniref:cytochrome P450 n=1 Tax=Epithele typhae TaxID=378194 RepID=UPI0020079652|nr:cytochrome P450 [Epithele typhae]KAH9928018.1 cytochrome P450 [Epithele typhae]